MAFVKEFKSQAYRRDQNKRRMTGFIQKHKGLHRICSALSLIASSQLTISSDGNCLKRRGVSRACEIGVRILILFSILNTLCFTHRILPFSLTMTFYSSAICGFTIQLILHFKRCEISNALYQVCRLSDVLNPRKVIENKYVCKVLVFISVSVMIYIAGISFYFYLEWGHNIKPSSLPLLERPHLREMYLGVVLASITFSATNGGSTCGVCILLCESIYSMIGDLIRSYHSNLQNKLKTQRLSTFIFDEAKNFKAIVSLVNTVEQAFKLCALLLYGAQASLIFITISIAVSKDDILRSYWINGVSAWNLMLTTFMYHQLTASGSQIYDESERLKNVSVECAHEICQHSIVGSNANDGSLQALSLLLANIRDVPLMVTGGGLFVIRKAIILTMVNSVVTYGVIMYQLSDL
ncbi:hypothetical protein AVEN_52447-1 [Araneus ventricosus]|uniref:Gustatory receptor n=1 Tax=Araneus ventricosus TaxID=182803 RepID=A0A4Y2CXZ8_ARAVE|nr:hypothetical protein AVEN_52447-1 [Araneus ventricosus]